ncbi:MAG: hypothetical protein ABIZ50_08375, partial [Solirubrobacterales bacterium]
TRTLNAPTGARRTAAGALLTVAAGALAALALAPAANAAFTTAQCDGAGVTGRGASFARDAHGGFKLHFESLFCVGSAPTVSYEPLGSGAGRRSMGERSGSNADGSQSRNQAPRFGMSDEPPSPAGIAQMNMGTDAAGDEGLMHVIPAAVGAVAPLVNFPNDCDVNLLPTSAKTAEQNLDGDATPDDVIRVRFTKAQFDKVWAKDADADSWTEVFPELAPDADCNKPIIRVVRFDDSGTSFAFKDYLDQIAPARNWIPGQITPDTRTWPGATVGARVDCANATGPGSQDDATDQLTSGCSNGNGALVSKLIATDGSIGYSDISTARNASPSLAITPEANDNDTYWTQILNGSNAFAEPTADSNGFRTDGAKGANCQVTTFTGVPTSTLGDWSSVSGVNSPAGYGICSLTYGLLFDDNADAYGNTPAEEQKAHTVKDYWTDVVSPGGQGTLFPNDYSPLPQSVLTIATTGVNAVSFNKGSGGGPGPEPGPGPGPAPGPGPSPTPIAPPLASNVFSVPRTVLVRNGSAKFSVRVPGAGTIEVLLTFKSKGKTVRVGRVRRTVSKAGTYKITVKPGRAAKKVLRKKGRLKTKAKLSFTPRGGKTRSSTRSVTLKLKRRTKRR